MSDKEQGKKPPPTPPIELTPSYHFDTDTYGIKNANGKFVKTGFSCEEEAKAAARSFNSGEQALRDTALPVDLPVMAITPSIRIISKPEEKKYTSIKVAFAVSWIIIFLLANGAFNDPIGRLYERIFNHPPTPQQLQKAAEMESKKKAKRRATEIQYETWFWKSHSELPIIAQVMMPDGTSVTGRIQFIIDCPARHWCAQPDGHVSDENGEEPLIKEEKAMNEESQETPDGP